MSKVSIPNFDVKVWTRKIGLPQCNFLYSLTQPEIKILGPFELIDIEYDWIKCEIARMERVEYNTSIGVNVMTFGEIVDFVNL